MWPLGVNSKVGNRATTFFLLCTPLVYRNNDRMDKCTPIGLWKCVCGVYCGLSEEGSGKLVQCSQLKQH